MAESTEGLWMSAKERDRLKVLHEVKQRHITLIRGLLGPAFTVAMLGAIESLMSAVVSDRMSNAATIRTSS
jgi:MFS superfamily sulfate permease-like transporter